MTTTTATHPAPDVADVYATHLAAVWRFVRSRIPDHHEAYDVTSDVFVRAWRSWDRFDPDRGAVEPWLFTIAHRALADWWRARRDVPVDVDANRFVDDQCPETELLTTELLGQLGAALDRLPPRERDALALRFAARLSIEHIARVLGTSPGAAKMAIHRTIHRLRAQQMDATSAAGEPADLEAIIDDLLTNGHSSLPGNELSALLLAMSRLHDPAVPDDLPSHVATCVQCASADDVREETSDDSGGRDRWRGGGRFANGLAAITAFMGVCLVCTVPALQALTFALGVGLAGYVVHLVGVAGAPLVAWVVYRGTRRHGRDRAFRLARAGAIVMVGHALLHVAFEVLADAHVAGWLETTGTVTFVATDWIATLLLVVGATMNLVETQRWRRAQAQGLTARRLVAPA